MTRNQVFLFFKITTQEIFSNRITTFVGTVKESTCTKFQKQMINPDWVGASTSIILLNKRPVFFKQVSLKLYMLRFITEPLSSNNKKLFKSKIYFNVSTYRNYDVITRQVFCIQKDLCYDKTISQVVSW